MKKSTKLHGKRKAGKPGEDVPRGRGGNACGEERERNIRRWG
jgi:hypothetical protein